MKGFITDDFLLTGKTAKILYRNFASNLPIIDYHCHLSPEVIAKDEPFEDLARVWLGGDHYKWRLMRQNGTDEKYITGPEFGKQTFLEFAKVMPKCIGNPVYHWAHLELLRYFDCDLPLTPDTAEEIWKGCNEKLKEMRPRKLIKQSNVRAICTTDDPIDSLEWHKALKSEENFKTLPTYRPDKAVNIDKNTFSGYIRSLGGKIENLDSLKDALTKTLDKFNENGCVISDHGLDYIPPQASASPEEVFKKALNGESITKDEADAYKSHMLLFFGMEYKKRNMVMQLHTGALRNVNSVQASKSGPDTGYDAIGNPVNAADLGALLDKLNSQNGLPKTILYSLNPNDNAVLTSVGFCFKDVRHGSAWWFNDTKLGMETQIYNLADMGVLGGFIGMLTDSRSLLSYARHEYFRRILCNILGNFADSGEYPNDMKALGDVVRDICYNNTKDFVGL